MFLEINPSNPDARKIKQAVEILREGGVVIYPTDTVYGLGCDIFNHKAVEKVCRIRGLNPDKAMLSFMCKDISQLATFTAPIDNNIFKMIRRNTPGPFTFILRSNNDVPKLFKNKKRTVGIRIPNNKIIFSLIDALGNPIMNASLKSEDDILEYYTDPYDIREAFEHEVDAIIAGENGYAEPSTVVNCTSDEVEIIREGAGLLV